MLREQRFTARGCGVLLADLVQQRYPLVFVNVNRLDWNAYGLCVVSLVSQRLWMISTLTEYRQFLQEVCHGA